MGVTAAEVGIKNSIGSLIPDSKWLVENLITPPIIKLLTDYWPVLTVKNKIKGNSQIPKSIIDLLKKGVGIRNKIVHVGVYPPHFSKIEEILTGIKELLLLLDYYCGFDFVYPYVDKQVIAELN